MINKSESFSRSSRRDQEGHTGVLQILYHKNCEGEARNCTDLALLFPIPSLLLPPLLPLAEEQLVHLPLSCLPHLICRRLLCSNNSNTSSSFMSCTLRSRIDSNLQHMVRRSRRPHSSPLIPCRRTLSLLLPPFQRMPESKRLKFRTAAWMRITPRENAPRRRLDGRASQVEDPLRISFSSTAMRKNPSIHRRGMGRQIPREIVTRLISGSMGRTCQGPLQKKEVIRSRRS